MFESRLDFEADLDVLSPLHVGTGGDHVDGRLRDPAEPGGNEGTRLADIVRDLKGWPCVPGSSIKGFLRKIGLRAGLDAGDLTALFGVPREDAVEGREGAGRLWVWSARLAQPPRKPANLPHGDETGTFVEARTRIDRQTGTAQEGLLFHQEMVAPGAVLRMRFTLLRPTPEDIRRLARILAVLAEGAGVALGKGSADGGGRVRLKPETIRADERRLSGRKLAVARSAKNELVNAIRGAGLPPRWTWRLSLHCPGPYVTVDSSNHSLRGRGRPNAGEESQAVQIMTRKDPHGKPVLNPTALMGVLRGRAAWLEALAGNLDPGKDERDGIFRPRDDADNKLTPIQRLFGFNGWRGMLKVIDCRCDSPGIEKPLTSLSIDRFSGGPLDGALFKTTTHVGGRFTVELALEDRSGDRLSAASRKADRDLADRLLADVQTGPLFLGHGSTKGFGWFDVTVETRADKR